MRAAQIRTPLAFRRALTVENLESRDVPSTWIGGAHVNATTISGDPDAWSNPYNWLGGVPGPGGKAVFTNSVSFSLYNPNDPPNPVQYNQPISIHPVADVPFTISGLSISSDWEGDLTVDSPLVLSGASTLANRSITLNAGMTNLGTLTIDVTNNLGLYGTGTLSNPGSIIQTGDGLFVIDAELNTPAGGMYEIQDSCAITNFGLTTTFTNEGTLGCSVGSGRIDLSNFRLTGDVDVASGTLYLLDGTLGSNSVALKVAAGATLEILSEITGTIKGSGGGRVDLLNGVTLAGDTHLDLPAPMLQWTNGRIILAGHTLTNKEQSVMKIASPILPVDLEGPGQLINEGTIEQANSLNIGAGATLHTTAGGVYVHIGGLNYPYMTGTFQNSGTLRVVGGDVTIGGNGKISGLIDVQLGQLGISVADIGGAMINVAPLGALRLGSFVTAVAIGGTLSATGGGTVYLDNVICDSDATLQFTSAKVASSEGSINLNGKTLTNAAGTTFTLATAGDVSLIGGGSFVNKGIMIQAGTGNVLLSGTGPTLVTAAGGIYEMRSNTQVTNVGSAPGTMTVAGTLRRSTGTGTASITTNLVVTGTVEVQSGTLAMAAILGAAQTANSPTVIVAPGATLALAGPWIMDGAVNLTGNITATKSGLLTLAADVILSGNGTLINDGMIRQNGDLLLASSNSAIQTTVNGVYDIRSDGSVAGPGNFTVAGTLRRSVDTDVAYLQCNFTLSGIVDVQSGMLVFAPEAPAVGTVMDAKFMVASGATLNLAQNAPFVGALETTVNYIGQFLATGGGRLLLADDSNGAGVMKLIGDATFLFPEPMFQWTGGTIDITGFEWTNLTGSVVTIDPSPGAGVTLEGGGALTNHGTIRHLGQCVYINAATTLDTTAGGRYDFRSGHISFIFSTPGAFRCDGDLQCGPSGGSAEINSNFTLSGTVNVLGTVLSLNPHFGATGNVDGALLNVSGSFAALDLAGSGVVNYRGTIAATGNGTLRLFNGTLALSDDATFDFKGLQFLWTTGGIALGGHTLTIAQGTVLTIANAADVFLAGGGTLLNAGSIVQTGSGDLNIEGSGTTLTNAGLYDIQGNGAPGYSAASGTFVNQGTLRRSVGTGTAVFTATIVYVGTIEVLSGSLVFPGTMTLTSGAALGGGGVIFASIANSGGIVSPGNSPGRLTVQGNYSQSGTGELRIDLDGTTAALTYDQLAVNGVVNLGGVLRLRFGYAAKAGDSYVILTNDGVDPIGSPFTGLPEGQVFSVNGVGMVITYKGGDGNDVALTVQSNTASPPRVGTVQINGGAVQRSRVTSIRVPFDVPVSLPVFPADAFELKRQGDNAVVNLSAAVDNSGPITVVTLTFNGGAVNFGSLADGRYTLTVIAAKVAGSGGALDGNGNGVGGDDFVLVGAPGNGLFRLFGDADGNGSVDAIDFGAIRMSFGTANPVFDFDGGGAVDALDFGQFRQRFGTGV